MKIIFAQRTANLLSILLMRDQFVKLDSEGKERTILFSPKLLKLFDCIFNKDADVTQTLIHYLPNSLDKEQHHISWILFFLRFCIFDDDLVQEEGSSSKLQKVEHSVEIASALSKFNSEVTTFY